MANNRHDYFIEEIETVLDTIPGLNILTEFDLDKWNDGYRFPFSYTELLPEKILWMYEDWSSIEGAQEFIIWTGIETNKGGDLRKVYSALQLEIEKAFNSLNMEGLVTSDFKLKIKSYGITGTNPVANFGSDKFIFIITGTIEYNLDWL